jgi:hypothetical protein
MIVLGLLKRRTKKRCELQNTFHSKARTRMARRTRPRSTFLVTALTGILCILILKYSAALSNAACAVTGTILLSISLISQVRWQGFERRTFQAQ